MFVFFLMRIGWVALDLIWWRVSDRAVRSLRFSRLWRTLIGAFAVAQIVYVLYSMAEPFTTPPDLFPLAWHVSAYIWHLGIILVTTLLWTVTRGIKKLRRATQTISSEVDADVSSHPGHPSRRHVLSAVAIAAIPPLASSSLAAVSIAQLGQFRVKRERVIVPGLPADLDGLTIAHVSDLHIGKFLPSGMMARVVEATNSLKADVVAFTGDLIDMAVEDTAAGIDFIRRLDPRGGLGMIEGNHDTMVHAERFESEIKAAGLPLLLDEAKTIRLPGRSTPLQFLGITWGEWKLGREIGRTRRVEIDRKFRVRTTTSLADSVQRVAGLREAGAFPILLAHHPHAFDEAARCNLPLTLAGHTHGGQLMLTERMGIGPLRFRYWTGAYQHPSASLFVNNGVGNWFPLRMHAPAEIVHLTLARA